MLADASAAATDHRHALGQVCSLLTAIVWAYALVLFKLTGERIAPIALNLFKNAVGLVLLTVTLAVLIVCGQDSLAVLWEQRPDDLCLLLLSGLIGIALADTIFFYALNLIGVGLLSVVDCAYSPLAILFAWLLLREKLGLVHYAGAALIVVGVFVASRHKPPAGRTRAQIVAGMGLAVLAVSMMAFGIVLAKPVVENIPLIWASTLRMAGGSAFLVLFALLGRGWKTHWSVFRPSLAWKTALPASILGTYVCMILWVAGFKYTYASVAAVLNQTSVVFASILAVVILKEHFDRRKIAALVLALIGVAIVTFGDRLTGLWL